MTPKISIIVPVYKVEKYLRKCLNSCLSINLKQEEYEIIIVNDGSPDDSISIAREFESKYDNILVYTKDNGGLSSARNLGLSKAKGEYIWFVDSDDYISGKHIANILNDMQQNKIQILAFNWLKVRDDSNLTPLTDDKDNKLGTTTAILEGRSFFALLSNTYFACRFIFERQFLIENSFYFKKDIFFEDLELIPKIVLAAGRAKGISNILYYYRQREDSILNNYNSKLIIDALEISKSYFWLAKTDCVYKYLGKRAFLIAFHYSAKPDLYYLNNRVLSFGHQYNIKNIYNDSWVLNSLFNTNMRILHSIIFLKQKYHHLLNNIIPSCLSKKR